MDIVAVKDGAPILAIFLCSQSWESASIECHLLPGKPEALAWIAGGGELEAWSWRKRGRVWQLTRDPIKPPTRGNPATTFGSPAEAA